ncbi:hypothetical protein EUX98_g7015 [Antrodiella citrinella]|uniref:Uncharacterized protein n=1 Tax=Antrodiella citrinella TaxID=2447956 RepID=A0A4S4MQ32_9APHY|nr:hypothetical protein EUX98_g7015 [Antrodiella citrinella]
MSDGAPVPVTDIAATILVVDPLIGLEQSLSHSSSSLSQPSVPELGCNSTFDHTILPTELWLEIFRYATYVPRSRDLTIVDPFAPERLPNFAWGVNNPVLSLRTKCTLVQVCKAWRVIATELLYEHIVVASIHRAKLIIRTFQDSASIAKAAASESSDGANTVHGSSKIQVVAKGHGQWVRHVEIRSCTRNTSKLPFLKLVAVILTYTTSLRVLNGAWTIPVPMEFLAIILYYHGQTLRGLGWEQTDRAFNSAVKNIQASDVTDAPLNSGSNAILSPDFLPMFQQLRILDLRTLPKSAIMTQYQSDFGLENEEPDVATFVPVGQVPTSFSAPSPIMVLPHVTTLRLPSTPGLLTYAAKISLPALRDLLLDASNVAPYDSSPALPAAHHVTTLSTSLLLFLTVHGASLSSLELVPPISSSYKPSPYPVSPGLFLQPGVCPNLERLVYDCRERTMIYPAPLSLVRGIRKKGGTDSEGGTPSKASQNTTSPTSFFPELKDLAYLLSASAATDLITHPHPSLRLIAIRGLGISRLYPNRPTHTQSHLLSLLSACMSGYLPALETVRTAGFLVDTSTDGLARDIFIWWTERFEYMGVDLVDGEGVMWLYEDEKASKETGKGGVQGKDVKGKELEQGSEAGDTSKKPEKGAEMTSSSKINDDGSPTEVIYIPVDYPSYVHKKDPMELAARDIGQDIEDQDSGLD